MQILARLLLLLFCCSALWMPGAFAHASSPEPVAVEVCHGLDAPASKAASHTTCNDCLICAGSCVPMQFLPQLLLPVQSSAQFLPVFPLWKSRYIAPEPEPPRA